MNARPAVLGLSVLLAACGRYGFTALPVDGTGDAGTTGDGASDGIDAAPATARAIATGRNHSCAILAGILSCWGDNSAGQLGLGDRLQRLGATAVDPAPMWTAVACGALHTCAIKSTGSLWCWGENLNGQLGLGTPGADVLTPMPVTLPAATRRIASRFDSTCAVLVDGSLWCWGVNTEGQLGQNMNTAHEAAPVRVTSATDWMQVSVGQGHTIAASAGSLHGTGRNSTSELGLGLGANTQYQVMTQIDAGPWQTTTAGQQVSMGIRSDGSLWGWGEAGGPLGFATTQKRDIPERVDMQLWTDVGVDTFHGCGVLASGGMRCWGRNVEGQLGRGDTMSSLTPVVSGGSLEWERVAVGRFHNCAQRRDGAVWCTGENVMGELGTGDLMRRNAWTQVTLP